jgi:hypothetical protein
LERYLEKIIAIKAHIDFLAKYAHSPRLRRHFFHKEFMVEAIGQPARNIVMPKPSDWGSIISHALQFEQDASSPELDDIYAALRSNRKYRGTIRTPVHCECALIVHFHNRHESKVPPVEYIGVNKLSCKGCALFFEAFNAVASTRFCTRGSHQKWYFPWAVPQYDARIIDQFGDNMVRYLQSAADSFGIKLRRYSNSSSASRESDCSVFDVSDISEEELLDECDKYL